MIVGRMGGLQNRRKVVHSLIEPSGSHLALLRMVAIMKKPVWVTCKRDDR